MTEQENIFFEQANEIIVNIMFCATCKDLVTLNGNNDNYFYTIFCLQITDSDNYVIFTKIFKPLKKKNKFGTYFKIHSSNTQLLENLNDANSYLKNFITSFKDHKRSICDFNTKIDSIPAGEAILLINEWEKSVIEHYNSSIPSSLKAATKINSV